MAWWAPFAGASRLSRAVDEVCACAKERRSDESAPYEGIICDSWMVTLIKEAAFPERSGGGVDGAWEASVCAVWWLGRGVRVEEGGGDFGRGPSSGGLRTGSTGRHRQSVGWDRQEEQRSNRSSVSVCGAVCGGKKTGVARMGVCGCLRLQERKAVMFQ